MNRALTKRYIPRMDTEVTFLGFGALEIGRNWGLGDDQARPEEEVAGQVLNTVLDLGINLIDTASAYHRSEERIGKYVSGRRNEYVLATKCGEHSSEPTTYYDFSYEGVSQSIDRSLKLLNTDVIDLIQIHFGPDSEGTLDRGETLRAMKDAQKAGKVRYLGASIDGDLAKRCIMMGDFDVMQMGYNLFHQANAENIRLCKERGMGVLIRSGLGNGLLTPRVAANLDRLGEHDRVKAEKLLKLVEGDTELLTALGLHFLYENDGISSVIVGTKKPENVKKNFELLGIELPAGLLEKAKEIVK
jgi:aryl-alcohol dehydrogenase-like predicted oxidoreductase